jgi:hypothetical protein
MWGAKFQIQLDVRHVVRVLFQHQLEPEGWGLLISQFKEMNCVTLPIKLKIIFKLLFFRISHIMSSRRVAVIKEWSSPRKKLKKSDFSKCAGAK